jgi:hypothetical protein
MTRRCTLWSVAVIAAVALSALPGAAMANNMGGGGADGANGANGSSGSNGSPGSAGVSCPAGYTYYSSSVNGQTTSGCKPSSAAPQPAPANATTAKKSAAKVTPPAPAADFAPAATPSFSPSAAVSAGAVPAASTPNPATNALLVNDVTSPPAGVDTSAWIAGVLLLLGLLLLLSLMWGTDLSETMTTLAAKATP